MGGWLGEGEGGREKGNMCQTCMGHGCVYVVVNRSVYFKGLFKYLPIKCNINWIIAKLFSIGSFHFEANMPYRFYMHF